MVAPIPDLNSWVANKGSNARVATDALSLQLIAKEEKIVYVPNGDPLWRWALLDPMSRPPCLRSLALWLAAQHPLLSQPSHGAREGACINRDASVERGGESEAPRLYRRRRHMGCRRRVADSTADGIGGGTTNGQG
ncbi:hypothetical protein U1Q18_015850 [Sarracenia purpurea var. burkii]